MTKGKDAQGSTIADITPVKHSSGMKRKMLATCAVLCIALLLPLVVAASWKEWRKSATPDRPNAYATKEALGYARVGSQVFAIPNAYIYAAGGLSTDRNNPKEASEVPLIGWAPDFRVVDRGTIQFQRARGSDPVIFVMLERVRKRSPKMILEARRQHFFEDAQVLSRASTQFGEHVVLKEGPTFSTELGDLYLDSHGSITTCNRYDVTIISPSCTTLGVFGPNILSIRYGRKWFDRRQGLVLVVRNTILSWAR